MKTAVSRESVGMSECLIMPRILALLLEWLQLRLQAGREGIHFILNSHNFRSQVARRIQQQQHSRK